ncbi:hypothetical protein [Nonomuraea dietziae]|uniref:SCO4225 family membrane protein n=1 Tax=Nonomuraea dietziae TaxID=65515 RepID=UPI0033EC3685
MSPRLKSDGMFPLLIVVPYVLLIIKFAVDTWPKAGMGGGLEFLLNLFVAAPLSFVFAAIMWAVRPVVNVGAHGFLVTLVVAGLVQAALIWWLMLRGLRRRHSK